MRNTTTTSFVENVNAIMCAAFNRINATLLECDYTPADFTLSIVATCDTHESQIVVIDVSPAARDTDDLPFTIVVACDHDDDTPSDVAPPVTSIVQYYENAPTVIYDRHDAKNR